MIRVRDQLSADKRLREQEASIVLAQHSRSDLAVLRRRALPIISWRVPVRPRMLDLRLC